MPPVLYRQAKDCRFWWTRRQVPPQVRNVGLIYRLNARLLVQLFAIALLLSGPAPLWAKKAVEEPEVTGDAAVGKKFYDQIVAEYGTYDVNGLADRVQSLGQELAGHAPEGNYNWQFTVLDMELPNAFALPGGYICVTRGLIAQLNDEAQLAAVLSHEIGHVTARHAARQHTAARMVGRVTGAISRSGMDLSSLFGAGLVRGYGREMELEADQTGAQLLAAAGFDPAALIIVLDQLKAHESYLSTLHQGEGAAGSHHAMLASHPDKDRRTRELVDAARATATTIRDNGRDHYLEMVDGLAWYGSTKAGVIRDQTFYHAGLDFSVTFPPKWIIVNLPDRLVSLPPAQDASIEILAATRGKKLRRVPVEKYLQKSLGMRKWLSPRKTTINGLPAYITMVPGARTLYGPRLVRVAAVYHGQLAFVLRGATQDAEDQRAYDKEFLSIIESLQPLGDANRHLAEPVRLRVIEVPAGTTFANLAEQSEYADESVLRLINGMYPGDAEPLAGSKIKIIE